MNSKTSEKSNEPKQEIPVSITPAPANSTSAPGKPPKIAVNSKFLVHDSTTCKGITNDFDVYFFDYGNGHNSDEISDVRACIKKFKAAGKIVMSYLSAGSAEDWRSDWKELSKYKTKGYDGWPGEVWLAVQRPEVLALMKKRIDNLKTIGFDGFYTDNSTIYVDGENVTLQQNIDYLVALADYAHINGMYMIPNGGEKVIAATVGKFDGYMGETISKYGGWDNYKLALGNYPIFNIVYKSGDCSFKKDVVTYYASGLGYSSFKRFCE